MPRTYLIRDVPRLVDFARSIMQRIVPSSRGDLFCVGVHGVIVEGVARTIIELDPLTQPILAEIPAAPGERAYVRVHPYADSGTSLDELLSQGWRIVTHDAAVKYLDAA